MKHNTATNYYTGGFAELVLSPSETTYNYLKKWFTGQQSLGKAMALLGLPYEPSDNSVLEVINNNLVVNLASEEETLYRNTIFTYKQQFDVNKPPRLTVSIYKLFNPICLVNTFKHILVQSTWIGKIDVTVALAKQFIEEIPLTSSSDPDNMLQDIVWPRVIALGLIAEFYEQLIVSEAKDSITEVHSYMGIRMSEQDWFFRSYKDQEKVRSGKLSFNEYINLYGLRADKDYDLVCPRWYEIPSVIKERITSTKSIRHDTKSVIKTFDPKLKRIIDAAILLQLLRSEAKRKALYYINKLRKSILPQIINDGTATENRKTSPHIAKAVASSEGKGTPVSKGVVTGTVYDIRENTDIIPENTICVFPNASPEFASQYPKCKGMVFLIGGQMSHGSIVAREYGIPTLIDSNAQSLPDGTKLSIDGGSGEWNVVE